MVIVLSENEKAEPPPYTPEDPSLRTSSGSTSAPPALPRSPPALPRGAAPPPLPTRGSSNSTVTRPKPSSYLRISRINEDIMGNWDIIPPSSAANSVGTAAPPPPSASVGPNVYFETTRGHIDVAVAWVKPDGPSTFPRARIEALNQHGSIYLSNTARPAGLPLHIKATSLKKGNVKICTPPEFHGILALKIPAGDTIDWRTRIGLGDKLAEHVSCTRETAPTIKGKGKDKALDGRTVSSSASSDQILVEFLVGADLETSHFNLAAESGPSALDVIEVDIREGRVLIVSPEDAALGNDQFPELPVVAAAVAGRTWRVPGLMSFTGGGVTFALKDRGPSELDADHPGITIVIDEPKWFGAVKKWGKFGGDSKKEKFYETKDSSLRDRKYPVSPYSSTTTLPLSNSEPVGRNSTSSPMLSPTHSPSLSPTEHRRHHSATDTPFQNSYNLHVPAGMTRTSRSASASNLQSPTLSPPPAPPRLPGRPSTGNSPRPSMERPHRHSFSEEDFKNTHPPPPAPPRMEGRRGMGYGPGRTTVPIPSPPSPGLPRRAQHWEQYRMQHQQQPHLPPRNPQADTRYATVGSGRRAESPVYVRLPDTGNRLQATRSGSNGSVSPATSSSNASASERQKLTKPKPNRTKSTPDLREKLKKDRGRC